MIEYTAQHEPAAAFYVVYYPLLRLTLLFDVSITVHWLQYVLFFGVILLSAFDVRYSFLSHSLVDMGILMQNQKCNEV